MSTAAQVPGTLNRFFADVPSVVLLKLETDRVGSFKRLSWDGNDGQSESQSLTHPWSRFDWRNPEPPIVLCRILPPLRTSEAAP